MYKAAERIDEVKTRSVNGEMRGEKEEEEPRRDRYN